MDEDSQDKRLVTFLREAGHDVITANEAGLMSQPDPMVLSYACLTNRVLLTLNCRDFEVLHAVNPNYPGILAVYQDANSLKKMNFKAIVKAIANLEAASIPLVSQFIPLNQAIAEGYESDLAIVIRETPLDYEDLPDICPYTAEQILDNDFLPSSEG